MKDDNAPSPMPMPQKQTEPTPSSPDNAKPDRAKMKAYINESGEYVVNIVNIAKERESELSTQYSWFTVDTHNYPPEYDFSRNTTECSVVKFSFSFQLKKH